MARLFPLVLRRGTPTALAAAAFAAAGLGVAASSILLASESAPDVVAGAAAGVAAPALSAAGFLFLAARSRSARVRRRAARLFPCLLAVAPPGAAVLSWHVLYFGLFVYGLLLVPVALGACFLAALAVSWAVADGFGAARGRPRWWAIFALAFAPQLAGIVGSWPAFVAAFRYLDASGYKVGWS